MLRWLGERLGQTSPFPRLEELPELAAPASLPELGDLASAAPDDRFRHSRGQGLPDLLRVRTGTVPRTPDAVARPRGADDVEHLLRLAEHHDLSIVPWGGGTSVTGGVNLPDDGPPVVTLDLERLAGLRTLDEESGLATFGAGTFGPALEKALEPEGWRLGHYPQSFELSTLGGWIAARSAGQESFGTGRIEDLVAGLELVAPAGRISCRPLPASASGPDLRQLVLGSEGRFGIVTEATVRIHRRPESFRVEAALLPDWDAGVRTARTLARANPGLSLLRLSDPPETEVALTVGLGEGWVPSLVRGVLRLRGLGPGACLLLVGAGGDPESVDTALDEARWVVGRERGGWLGKRAGRNWERDRFRHPYLRDGLLDRGIATDTLETAAPWGRLAELYAAVRTALAEPIADDAPPTPVLCHLSHPYPDGASLYFTFFFRAAEDPDRALEEWAAAKRRATAAIVAAGGTCSHHHGIGRWHAPWLADEIGATGRDVLDAVRRTLDPEGRLAPEVLLDPTDRLVR